MIGMGLMGSKHCQAILSAATRLTSCVPILPVWWYVQMNLRTRWRVPKPLYGFERGATSWQEVMTADDVDLVMICSPNGTHL